MLRSLHYVGPVAPPQSKKSCGRVLSHDDDDWRASQYLLLLSLILLCFCFCFLFCYCFTSRDTRKWHCVRRRCTGKLLFLYCCIFFSPASCIVVLVPSGRRASSSVPPGRRASSSGTSGRRAWHHALASVPPGIEPWPQPMVRRRCSGKLFFFFYIIVFSFSLTHHHQQFCFYVPAFLSPSFYTGWLLLLSSDSSSSVQPCPPVRWASSLGLRFAGHPALASTRRCTGKLLFLFLFCSHFISSHRRSRPWLIVVFSLLFQNFFGRSFFATKSRCCCTGKLLFFVFFCFYLISTHPASQPWLIVFLSTFPNFFRSQRFLRAFLVVRASSLVIQGCSLSSGGRSLSSRGRSLSPGHRSLLLSGSADWQHLRWHSKGKLLFSFLFVISHFPSSLFSILHQFF